MTALMSWARGSRISKESDFVFYTNGCSGEGHALGFGC